MEMILKTTNLCKSFSGQTVVNNISLNIERNSVYGLLGPNGAGKSTTLKMITGILKPTSGNIEFDDHTWKRNIIAPATAVYSLLHSITGSIGIILASVWQIPLCLYLAHKTGMFVPIVLNTILGIVLSTATALGNTIAWWFVPYCWAAKLAEPLMGIEINGTYAGNCGFSIAIMISISLSILLFLILSYADAKDFSKGR